MFKVLTGIIFISMAIAGHAEIRVVDSLTPIQAELDNCGSETLVLLDVGGTLITKPDAVLYKEHSPWKEEWYKRHYPNQPQDEALKLTRILEGTPKNWKIVDSSWPKLITKAQSSGAKVVAFTKIWMHPFIFGYHSTNLPTFGIILHDELSGLASGKSFRYAGGIIETGNVKGPALEEFIAKLAALPEKLPKRIVFVDDSLEQIESVDSACQKLNIPCVAFHYITYQIAPPLDEAIADCQLRTLSKEHRWISEDEARQMLSEKQTDSKR